MAGGVVRLGDPNVAGGVVTPAGCNPTVLVNGRPVAVAFGAVGPHAQYGGALLQLKNPTILVGGKPIASYPSVDSSGYPRLVGSLDVLIGGVG